VIYYIDINGSTMTNCTFQEYACTPKHFKSLISTSKLKLVAGDSVAFKRDQKFYITLRFNDLNGTEKKPISFLAYGKGEKPILTGVKKIYPEWQNEGNSQWSIPLKVNISRVWLDNKEQQYANKDKLSIDKVWICLLLEEYSIDYYPHFATLDIFF